MLTNLTDSFLPSFFQSAISSREPASHFVRLHNALRGVVSFFHGDDDKAKAKVEADERLMRIARSGSGRHTLQSV